MSFNFAGKRFLVTGASRGIGRLLATNLSSAGAEVFGLATNKELLNSLKEQCKNVHIVPVNLTDWDATWKALEQLPPMNGLVNNAAVFYDKMPSLSASKDSIDKTFAVNIMGAVNAAQVIGKKMVEAGKGGSIVNVSSIAGINPMTECLAYNMSKAALDMMTKQFAIELGPHNIRVNSVNPTVTVTDMSMFVWSDLVEERKLKGRTPLGRFAEVQECVGPIMYLLSEHSTMVTGTLHLIDGGFHSNALI